MASILKQLTQYQYHLHVLIIIIGFAIFMELIKGYPNYIIWISSYIAFVMLDAAAHLIMHKFFKWKD